jgi:(S)-ureidoglycine aminohydrolase
MNSNYILLLFLLPLCVQAQDLIKDGVYRWPSINDPGKKNTSMIMLSGSAHDLSSIDVSAQLLAPEKKGQIQVPNAEEHLLLVKSGTLTVSLNDTTYALDKGSIAMIMPGEKYFLQNNGVTSCEFHLMKYKSKLPADPGRGQSSGGSFVKDWNKLTFRPHERGGVRSYFDRPTANTKRFEMHVTTLKENFKSHDPHQHAAEEIILVLEGNVEMLIGEKSYQASTGDILFASTNVFHVLKNIGNGSCSYFAFQWE